jgi:hypothetical protein
MTTYEVKMGVPIPPKKGGGGKERGALRSAMESMPVGGMIEVPYTRGAQTGIASIARKCGHTMTTRRVGDSLCFWRTA